LNNNRFLAARRTDDFNAMITIHPNTPRLFQPGSVFLIIAEYPPRVSKRKLFRLSSRLPGPEDVKHKGSDPLWVIAGCTAQHAGIKGGSGCQA
jgi:hypothetical protein